MSFHISAYTVNAGINDANVDESFVTDDIFTARNSHLILVEQYNLLSVVHFAASATRARFNSSRLNSIARMQIWPVGRSATVPSNPNKMDLREMPIPLPLGEEIAIEESNNLGAATERTNTFLHIAPPTWNRNLPRATGIAGTSAPQRIIVRATATITVSANAWSASAALTFAETLRGGWYSVLGCMGQGTSDLAFRFLFPRAPFEGVRQLRPGGLMMEAIGDTPDWRNWDGWGLWGRFHGFEPPTVQVFALAAGATAPEFRFNLIYEGDANLPLAA